MERMTPETASVEPTPVEETPEQHHEGVVTETDSTETATGVDLAQVRELILAAHPDVVPEMVTGATFDDLMASIPAAREAYQRIAENLRQQPATPSPVPAGQPGRQTYLINVEALSPSAKIAEGLRQRRE